MLEERVKVWHGVNLEYTLACFKADQRVFDKKIKDTNFDPPNPAKSIWGKTDETPPKFGITHDECIKMITKLNQTFLDQYARQY